MHTYLKTGLWQQFGAAIDGLAQLTATCPDHLWHTQMWDDPAVNPEFKQVWYRIYHTLFWLDLYLTGTEDGFLPPAPFTLIEQIDDSPMPERPYTQAELLGYLHDCRQRTYDTIHALTDAAAQHQCEFGWGTASFFELLIYNLRHVQNHAAELSIFLGQHLGPQPDYPTQAH